MNNRIIDSDINMIRLVYVEIGSSRSYGRFGVTIGASSSFVLPEGMNLKDACKVISYLSEKVEKQYNLEPGCKESLARVSRILENYGFKKTGMHTQNYLHMLMQVGFMGKINIPLSEVEGCANLYTVAGMDLFRRTNLYNDYFEWFTENVKESEFNQIINKNSR